MKNTLAKKASNKSSAAAYGRLLKRGVAYGAMFPGYVDTMHQANEFMSLDDLFNAAVIYADAIYRLAK